MTTPATPAPQRRRPLGVVLIATFLVLDAALALAQRYFDLDPGARQDVLTEGDGRLSILVIVLVLARLVAAAGLWFGWRRGWVLTMLLVGISLVLDIWLYWEGARLYLRMAIDVILALYLNQKEVREYFEPVSPRREQAAPDARPADGA